MNESELKSLFSEVYSDVASTGLPVASLRNLEVRYNMPLGRAWGNCTKNWSSWNPASRYDYTIRFSETLCQHCKREAIMSTMAHELIHACDIRGHKADFRRAGKKLMDAFPGKYLIQRCTSAVDKMSDEQMMDAYKYIVKCEKCGATWGYQKLTRTVYCASYYRCRCGGSLVRVK